MFVEEFAQFLQGIFEHLSISSLAELDALYRCEGEYIFDVSSFGVARGIGGRLDTRAAKVPFLQIEPWRLT